MQIENEEVDHENLGDTQVPVFRAKFDYVRKDRRERVFIMESTSAAIVSHTVDKVQILFHCFWICLYTVKKKSYDIVISHDFVQLVKWLCTVMNHLFLRKSIGHYMICK